MAERLPGEMLPGRPAEDRLDSWKEIAAYLNRDVTTVQRWEKREGMPVHRHVHDRMGSVYAFRSELNAWTRSRKLPAPGIVEDNGLRQGIAAAPEPVRKALLRRWRIVLLLLGLAVVAVMATALWVEETEYLWRNPLTGARFQRVTEFDGVEQAAAVSRDGHLVAFLSNRDGPMDVWVTQVGSGEFHNLTHGSAPELVNPQVRTLGFSPDGALVAFWTRKQDGSGNGHIAVWAVPTLGGEARPYLEGAAEFDWSRDATQLTYHTPGPGDPMFVTRGTVRQDGQPIFSAPAGLHSHFPLWAPDGRFIYFVQGALPDSLDIWRIRPTGGMPERITSHAAHVSYPVLLDRRTLLYLASDPDGSGPWLYSIDVERRIPHRLSSGPDTYTSLAASANGRRLVLTLAEPKRTLWRLPIGDGAASSVPARISLQAGSGFSPRLGRDYLLYVSAAGSSEGIWKLANGTETELWRGEGAQVLGSPAISPDGRYVAFSVRQHGQALLYTMQPDGTNPHMVTDALDLQGSPAWTPDGRWITSAAKDGGVPRLFRIAVSGGAPAAFVREYSVDPVWSPDGSFAMYSGADVGTTFALKAVAADGAVHPVPPLTLTRGARHFVLLPGGREVVVLRGEIQHKDLWSVDLQTGAARQLTKVPADFDIRDFDISRDGREVVLERVQERSNVVLLDLAPH